MKFTSDNQDYEFEVLDDSYVDQHDYVEGPVQEIDRLYDLYCVQYQEKSTGLKYDAQIGVVLYPKVKDWDFCLMDLLEGYNYEDYTPNFVDDGQETRFKDAFIEAINDDIAQRCLTKIEDDEFPEVIEIIGKQKVEPEPEQPI
ncbi:MULTISPECIES: hypothetical protein [Vibrio]|uniref:hypothetical protein n=1 Tax=Vibrio TaxID=662 RepID=UPI00370AA89D